MEKLILCSVAIRAADGVIWANEVRGTVRIGQGF